MSGCGFHRTDGEDDGLCCFRRVDGVPPGGGAVIFASNFAWGPNSTAERGIPVRGTLWVGSPTFPIGLWFPPQNGTFTLTVLMRFSGSNTVTLRLYLNGVVDTTVSQATSPGINTFAMGTHSASKYDKYALTGDGNTTVTNVAGHYILEY